MLSKKKLLANQTNALKSTGPKTEEGKAIASQNTLKHGLLSQDLIIRDENQEELLSFRNQVYCTLQPHEALEELLVEKIINASWRLKRLTKAESEILGEKDFGFDKKSLRKSFMGADGKSIQTLSRYEISLERSFYKALHELQRLQAMRSGQPVLAPIAIDVYNNIFE